MRTKTFEDFAPTDEFKRDVKTLEESSPEELKEAASWFRSVEDFADLKPEETKQLVKIIRGKRETTDSFTSVVLFLLKEGHENKDQIGDLVHDLVDMKLLKAEARPRVTSFLEEMWPCYHAIRTATIRNTLPKRASWVLGRIATVSNLRPVITNEFLLGKDKLEGYDPKIERLVGVASVRMVLKKEDETEIVDIDLDHRALQRMIDMLQCAKIELGALQKIGGSLTRK